MITTATMHCMPRLYFQAHRKPGHGPSARCRSDARRQSAACHGCGISSARACVCMRCRNRHRRLPPACPRNSGPVLSTVFICPACWTRNRSFIWIAMSAAHWTSGNCGRRRLRSRAAVVLRAQSDGRRRGRAIVKKGLDPAHYFNSGVLVFHPHRLRALFPDLMAAVLRLLPELSRPLLYPDQDALNLLFRRLPLHWLGERFNSAARGRTLAAAAGPA